MRWRLILPALLGILSLSIATVGVVMPGQLPSVRLLSERLGQYELLRGFVFVSFAYGGWMVLSRGRLASLRTRMNSASESRETATVAPAEPESEERDAVTTTDDTDVDTDAISIFGMPVAKLGHAETEVETTASDDTKRDQQTDGPVTASAMEAVTDHTDHSGLHGTAETTNLVSVSPDSFDELQTDPPEHVQIDTAYVVGAEFDQLLTEIKANPSLEKPYENDALSERIRQPLVEFACRRGTGDREPVARHIQSGSWTDDRVAAAFLSTDDSVSPPLTRRLLAWLDPKAELEHAVNRTIAEITEQYEWRSVDNNDE